MARTCCVCTMPPDTWCSYLMVPLGLSTCWGHHPSMKHVPQSSASFQACALQLTVGGSLPKTSSFPPKTYCRLAGRRLLLYWKPAHQSFQKEQIQKVQMAPSGFLHLTRPSALPSVNLQWITTKNVSLANYCARWQMLSVKISRVTSLKGTLSKRESYFEIDFLASGIVSVFWTWITLCLTILQLCQHREHEL